MKITYDPDADAMYIRLKNDKVDKTKKIDDNTNIDYNKNGNVIGIELLFVKERNPTILNEITIKKLV